MSIAIQLKSPIQVVRQWILISGHQKRGMFWFVGGTQLLIHTFHTRKGTSNSASFRMRCPCCWGRRGKAPKLASWPIRRTLSTRPYVSSMVWHVIYIFWGVWGWWFGDDVRISYTSLFCVRVFDKGSSCLVDLQGPQCKWDRDAPKYMRHLSYQT